MFTGKYPRGMSKDKDEGDMERELGGKRDRGHRQEFGRKDKENYPGVGADGRGRGKGDVKKR
jgi:hypothetical protein